MAASSKAQGAPSFEADPIYQLARTQAKTDLQKAFGTLEAAIAKAPDDSQSVPYYLSLGRLKKEYESYPESYAGSSYGVFPR